MTEKLNPGGLPATRKKYPPAFRTKRVRQVAAGARQSDVARAQGISPALLALWQRQALEAAVSSSTERDGSRQQRGALKRVEMERSILRKVATVGMLRPQYPNRLGQEPLRLYCGLFRTLARAALVPGSVGTRPRSCPLNPYSWP